MTQRHIVPSLFGRATLVAILALCSSPGKPLLAQTNTAEIQGIIRDPTGALLTGASVIVISASSGLRIERTSDAAGRFFVAGIPVGEYSVTVRLDGFKTVTRPTVLLQVGQRIELAITLLLGERSENVTVSAGVPLLQTANAEISDVIDNRRVQELPLNGRQFLQLAQLSDGVVVPPGGTRGAALEQAGPLPAVLGQRSGHNIYLLDGVKVTDEYFNNLVVSPSVDAIQEFKIQKTLYPVEFGGKASALINVVTKSGNNAFRGGAVEFFRSDTLDSRNYFDDPEQPVPLLRQHQFGGHLGGPFRRDRTFFFIDYEGQRVDRSLTQTFSVPTAAMRRGDFAGLPVLCDPLTRTATGCTPFAGNQIPTSRFSPVAVGLLAHVPQPTAPGAVQNLLAVEPQHTPMDQGTVRIDHRLTDDNTLFGRFTVYHVRDAQPFGTSSLMEPLPLTIGQDVKAQLRNDLDLELKAVVMYNEAITVATEAGDNASRELFERLLKDEEQHVDFLEAQHHQIEQLGYERYLAQQIQGADHT